MYQSMKEKLNRVANRVVHEIDNATGAIKVAAGTGLTMASGAAMALPPDYTSLTDAVDFSGVVTAILAVGGIAATFYIAVKGVTFILHFLKRA